MQTEGGGEGNLCASSSIVPFFSNSEWGRRGSFSPPYLLSALYRLPPHFERRGQALIKLGDGIEGGRRE